MKAPFETESWKAKYADPIRGCVLKGNYEKGLVLARKAFKLFPKQFEVRYLYAKLLGDWADELPKAQQRKHKLKAAKILKKLTQSLAGQPFEIQFGVCLNYYYQSERFHSMYQYGKRLQKRDRKNGFYSQGLGSGLLAWSHRNKKSSRACKSWAKKSITAWKHYGFKNEIYYFAHYSYAKALALSENYSLALEELKKAARLSKRPLTDWEFSDVLELCTVSPP